MNRIFSVEEVGYECEPSTSSDSQLYDLTATPVAVSPELDSSN